MTVEQLKAVPAEMAKRIGDFMMQQGYRLVFDRWYKQAPADAIRQAAESNPVVGRVNWIEIDEAADQ